MTHARRPLRVTAIVDDNAVSGKTQPIVSFAKQAQAAGARGETELSIVAFSRRGAACGLASVLQDEGLDVRLLEERRTFDWRAIEKLNTCLDQTAADIVWTHSSKTHFLARLGNADKHRRWVAFHHGYTSTSVRWKAYQLLDRWSLTKAASVMVPCDAFRSQVVRLGVSPRLVRVCPTPNVARTPAACESAIRLREALGIPAQADVVLSIGRLSKEKRHDVLIRSFHALRRSNECHQTFLVLVGGGPEREHLERLVDRLGLNGAVVFTGRREDVAVFYAMASVFALTSDSEGTPNVILEAMHAETPIVATKAGGVAEMLDHGSSALLVRCGDVDGIATGIAAILADRSIGTTLAARAKARLQRYAPERHYAAIRAAFSEVAGW
jgi:glycosyltransferase involved in cell wall biosynthesis